MNRLPRITALLAFAFFLSLSLTALLAGTALAQGAKAQIEEEQEEEYAPTVGPQGALEFRIQSEEGAAEPPGEMALINPAGASTGYNPNTDTTYTGIPLSSYNWVGIRGEGPPEAAVLYVNNPMSGLYTLRVIGMEYGKYGLYIRGFDPDGSHLDLTFTAIIRPGSVHHYVVNYSNAGGRAHLEARRTYISY